MLDLLQDGMQLEIEKKQIVCDWLSSKSWLRFVEVL